jgi:hypothetical protein
MSTTFQYAGLIRPPLLPANSPAAPATALLQRLRAALRRIKWHPASAPMEMGFCCGAHLALARSEFVVLGGVRQQALICEAGEVWVTLDGDSSDYVLGAGRSLAIASNAKVVVTATRAAVVRVVAA